MKKWIVIGPNSDENVEPSSNWGTREGEKEKVLAELEAEHPGFKDQLGISTQLVEVEKDDVR